MMTLGVENSCYEELSFLVVLLVRNLLICCLLKFVCLHRVQVVLKGIQFMERV